VLDVHLGKLARYLRLLGFDTRYRNDYDDAAIIGSPAPSHDHTHARRGLLKHGAVTHGYWVRETAPRQQLAEIVRVFDLRAGARPFTRCIRCNGELQRVPKSAVAERLPPRVRAHFENSRNAGIVPGLLARHALRSPATTGRRAGRVNPPQAVRGQPRFW